MIVKINNLKERLYKKLETKDLDHKEILKISQELDELIVEYCNLEMKSRKEN